MCVCVFFFFKRLNFNVAVHKATFLSIYLTAEVNSRKAQLRNGTMKAVRPTLSQMGSFPPNDIVRIACQEEDGKREGVQGQA